MKKFNLVLFMLFVLSSLIAAQQADTMDNTAKMHYNNGISYMKSNDFSKAIVCFDSSLQTTKDYKVFLQKAVCLYKLSKYDDAIAIYDQIIPSNKENDILYLNLANVYLAKKEYDLAEKNFKLFIEKTKDENLKNQVEAQIISIKNEQAIGFYNKGNELSKAGKFDDAIKEYDKALLINKDYKTYYQKGLTYSKMQKIEEAKTELNQAITLNPNFDLAYLALGKIQVEAKDFEGGIKSYLKAHEVSTNENLKTSIKETIARTYFTLGSNFFKEKKYDKAIENFTKSTDYSDFDQAFLFLGKAQNEKKQYDAALLSFDKAAQFKKTVTDGALAYNRALVYKNKGDYPKALEQFTLGLADANYKKACDSEIKFIKAKIEADKKKK